MKLEEGMYVRTKYGIARFIHNLVTKATIYRVIDKKIVYDNVKHWEDCLLDNEIIKASHNIIDLIQVGDYVNGLRVEKSKYGELYTSYTYVGGDIGLQQETYTTFLKDYEEDDIYSIVTKEQFENMSYEVE